MIIALRRLVEAGASIGEISLAYRALGRRGEPSLQPRDVTLLAAS